MDLSSTLIIGSGMLVSLIVLVALAQRGWIVLPKDSNALQMIALGGVLILGCAVCLLIVLSIQIRERGIFAVFLDWLPVFIFLFVGSLFGFAYYKRRQKREADVQQLNLDD